MEIIRFCEEIGHFESDLNLKKLKKKLYKLKNKVPVSDGNSNQAGWQKDLTYVDGFHFLKEYMSKLFSEYCASSHPNFYDQEKAEKALTLHFPKVFCNINPPNAYHNTHRHYGGQFTSVIWLQADENAGEIMIDNPFPTNQLYLLFERNISINSIGRARISHANISPKPNTGVIFNSSIMHNVSPNLSDRDRISLSFHIHIHDVRLVT